MSGSCTPDFPIYFFESFARFEGQFLQCVDLMAQLLYVASQALLILLSYKGHLKQERGEEHKNPIQHVDEPFSHASHLY